MKRVILIGASGGIGGAMAEAIAQRYPQADIHATYHRRPPASLGDRQWHPLDATNPHQVAEFAAQFERVDWLINCVGFLHNEQWQPEKALKQITPEQFMASMNINVMPTVLLAQAFSDAVRRSDQGVFATISAKVGSIEDNRIGGWSSYRASKAALNMMLKNIAIEWKRTHKKVSVAALHPGTTDTALSAPFQRGVPPEKLFSPQRTAEQLLDVIEGLTPQNTGQFWSWDGQLLPW